MFAYVKFWHTSSSPERRASWAAGFRLSSCAAATQFAAWSVPVRKTASLRVVKGYTETLSIRPATAMKSRRPETFVHLVGVSHPSPAKANEFLTVDLPAAQAAIGAAKGAGVRHFLYVSVAHPAPIMRDYLAVRAEVENNIANAGLNATILRPWYVLGPGRRWPILLLPAYWAMGALPATRDSAQRLGLVTLSQMIAAMAHSIDQPPTGIAVMNVPAIRHAGRTALLAK